MRYFSKKTVQSLLKQQKVFPKKRFGQNFLIDKNVLKKIIKAANLKPTAVGESPAHGEVRSPRFAPAPTRRRRGEGEAGQRRRPSGRKDIVLEIGSGIGNLTQDLAKNAKNVIAIEKDIKMVEILKETTKNLKNVKIINSDVLKLNAKHYSLSAKNYKIVANLPYYIVSPVIRKFLESCPPKLMVLMVQKEVAQRIAARPPNMNLLAVSVQFYAKAKIISYVSKKSFWPQPKIDSAIIKLVVSDQRLAINKNLFFKIVKAGFLHPRKQIINNLSRVLKIKRGKVENWLTKNKIRPAQRAETLSIGDWKKLTKTFPSINN